MKHILLSLLLLISVASYAQSDLYRTRVQREKIESPEQPDYNFKIIDNELVWQKTFDKKISATQTFETLSRNPRYTIRSNTDERIVLLGVDSEIPFGSRYHFKFNQLSLLVKGIVRFSATIDIKDDRYRLTISNIKFTTAVAGDSDISSIFIKKDGSVRDNFIYTSKPLDTYFSDIFGLGQKDDAEW